MKIRIKANSIRIRLSKTEVSRLADTGDLEEQTSFGENKFVYALKCTENGNVLSAKVEPYKITMLVPKMIINDWPQNSVVGFDAKMEVGNNEYLYLLLEKDFVCLDETMEDQSDNYENPNKIC